MEKRHEVEGVERVRERERGGLVNRCKNVAAENRMEKGEG